MGGKMWRTTTKESVMGTSIIQRAAYAKLCARWCILWLVTLLVLVSVSANAAQTAESAGCGPEPIRMADQTWESASFTTHVIHQILTHGYGCDVEIVPGTPAAIESALVQNDVQIIAEQWSGRSPIIEQGIER